MTREVVVVPTGVANLASVLAGLERAGAAPVLAADPGQVAQAERVVLPGVGTFGAAMAQLVAAGLVGPLAARVRAGRPTLAVCVGFQVLCEASEESPGVPGLGVIPGTLRRFAGVRCPQLGWNALEPTPGARLLPRAEVYFANSYRLTAVPPGWEGVTAEHGGRFVGGLERGPVLCCQFHPELSGAAGRALLGRWVAEAA